jgi:hypothetical protein
MLKSLPVERLFDYEEGELDYEETIELFQWLIDSGIVWHLQGRYGRTAMDLITSGECVA